MEKVFIAIVIIGLSANISYGTSYWVKTYERGYSDGAFSIQKTSDGGYIIPCNTYWFYHCICVRLFGLQMDDKPCKKGQPFVVCNLLYFNSCCYPFTGIECLLKKQLLLRRDRFYCSVSHFTGHPSTL